MIWMSKAERVMSTKSSKPVPMMLEPPCRKLEGETLECPAELKDWTAESNISESVFNTKLMYLFTKWLYSFHKVAAFFHKMTFFFTNGVGMQNAKNIYVALEQCTKFFV